MWRDYSFGYIKNNRSSGITIMIAAFISALLLSLLCGLFYNTWKYEVERIELEEGSWQSRITGAFDAEDVETIKTFGNVKDAVVNEKETRNQEMTIDIYFNDMRKAFEDTSRIVTLIGEKSETVIYNHELLAMYFIRDPQDTAPSLLFPLFLLITIMASVSLIVIIHNSFAVSMNARIYQFGIFSSIGATPKQIRSCLLQEAFVLCAIPVMTGNILGIVISRGLLNFINMLLGSSIEGRHEAVFGYHPYVLFITLFVTILTIWISAWLPARKLSRLTPLEAIKNTGELQLKCKKKSPFLTLLFGMEGELAGQALKSQRKALRTASLSLILSFMAFTIMQCFFSMSEISTRETYFERYQNVWDVMVSVKDTDVDSFEKIKDIQDLSGVKSAIAYQKAAAKRMITEAELSEEMKSFGGFSNASNHSVAQTEDGWLVNAPLIILDDASFQRYCEQIGITPRLDGAVVRNQIRDMTNPDFRHPEYMQYIKGEKDTSIIKPSEKGEAMVELPVLAYTEEVPALREEYGKSDDYELVHFMPASLWREIKEKIAGGEDDTYICILGNKNETLEELNELQTAMIQTIGETYTVESENRIQKLETNDRMIQGMMAIFSGFCVLLAIIGIGNVFSNTLGFVRQRKREFARYMSVGMTPQEIRKMFCIEALVIAGRPVLFTIPLAILVVGAMLRRSYLEVSIFVAEAPFISIGVFLFAIWGTVTFAYYLGWKKIRKINLAEVLRDDTMI